MPQYIDPTCGVALGHRITIPLTLYGIHTEDFGYTLGHKDYTVNSKPGDASISIKTGRFIDKVSAVNKEFEIKLYNLTQEEYTRIRSFARADYLNFLNVGVGNITLDLDEETYSGCYITSPIKSSESIYDTTTGIEYFQEVTLMVIRPSYTWY